MSNNNFITLENYKGSNILKGFVQEQKAEHTFESIEKSLHEGFEKGLISEDLLEKSLEELDLIKGGEGSRGGKIIGHTKSGKPVYEGDNTLTSYQKRKFVTSYKDFTPEDHYDAHKIHWNIANGIKDEKDKRRNYHAFIGNIHYENSNGI